LRAGIGGQFGGSATVGDADMDVGSGLIWQVGLGMAVPFAGLHFVPSLDYRRSSAGAVDFGGGNSGDLSSDSWIASVWAVF
jgi:hypothetical protein